VRAGGYIVAGLVVVDEGAKRAATLWARNWWLARKVGLYQNGPIPSRHTVLADLEPCTFGGYDGERTIADWTVAAMEGDRAVSRATPVLWTFDGIGSTGYVMGYYVVDGDGVLLWLEPRADGPVAMVTPGQTYQVVPVISVGTRYGAIT
jgi:hypothetical protein